MGDVRPFWGRGLGVAAPPAWSPVDLRGTLPTRPGAQPYHTRPLSAIVGVNVHYTASSPYATVRGIAAYQIGPQAQEAFPAIAYHLVVDYRGTVSLCHDLTTRTWHNGAVVGGVARNWSHIGLCYIGDDAPNAAQIDGLRRAIRWCEQQVGRKLDVEPHSAHYATACPLGWAGWGYQLA